MLELLTCITLVDMLLLGVWNMVVDCVPLLVLGRAATSLGTSCLLRVMFLFPYAASPATMFCLLITN
jgi:hypothetical protein